MLRGEKEIKEAKLLAVENKNRHRKYNIHMECPEFTCHCPMTGFPDFGTIIIDFVPDEKILELKSLKLYINKYRDEYIFHEDVVNKILDDLVKELDPFEMTIKGDFNVRGNIKTLITAKHVKG
ncbi:MAG: preQ(1) synthase [Pseudomonadota bacterium]